MYYIWVKWENTPWAEYGKDERFYEANNVVRGFAWDGSIEAVKIVGAEGVWYKYGPEDRYVFIPDGSL